MIYVLTSEKKGKNVKEALLLETYSHYVSFFRFFDKPYWIDEDRFGFDFYNNMKLFYSIKDQKVGWIHTGTEEEVGFIRSLIYKEFASEQERIEWINQ